jgi:hypothetical protein
MRGLRLLLIVCLFAVAAAPGAHASGITTHAFMADEARGHLETVKLRKLLGGHRSQLLSGGAWPDAGYAASSYPTGAFGEATHWERFVNAFVKRLRARCGPHVLERPRGRCSGKVAFLMGIAAHGVGDEMWDWMFEPQLPDHGESSVHPVFRSELPGFAELGRVTPFDLANTPEFAMDMVAIVAHRRVLELSLTTPPVKDLIAAYELVYAEEQAIPGRNPTLAEVPTRDAILAAHGIITAAIGGERVAAPTEYPRVALTMPWASAHMYDESGGVVDVAKAAAGYMDALWQKLTRPKGHPARPRVVAVHPEPGERGVPISWPSPEGKDLSGPADGLAENRIIAVLSNALPYPGTGLPALPESGFTLADAETGQRVAAAPGHPTPGPYGAGDGTHSMLFWPALDLQPCRWYVARVTRAVRDHAGSRLGRTFSWRFQTRAASEPAPAGCLAVKDPTALPGIGSSPQLSPGPTITDPLAQVRSDGSPHTHGSDHHDSIRRLGETLRGAL